MSVGIPINKQNLDAQAAQIVLDLRNTLAQASRMKAWLDGKAEGDLTALGYDANDVAVLKSAFTDLDALNKVAGGQQAVPAANDFLFWARRLIAYN